MTDQELIKQVAQECMGWIPKNHQWWIQEPSTATFPDGKPVMTERFTGFVSVGFNPFLIPLGSQFFNPLTNPAHWWMVLKRLVELGFAWDIEHTKTFDDLRVQVYLDKQFNNGNWPAIEKHYKNLDEIGKTICEAALEAVRGMK